MVITEQGISLLTDLTVSFKRTAADPETFISIIFSISISFSVKILQISLTALDFSETGPFSNLCNAPNPKFSSI
jgi:hypothetical protein